MAGVLGILDATSRLDVRRFLDEASAKLSHFEWYVTDQWCAPDAAVGLGRSGIGIFNKEAQPVVHEDGNLILFMAGEFYRTSELRQALEGRGYVSRDQSDPELALQAFCAYGEEFARHLQGAFVIAVYDVKQQRLTITNDRYGLYPLYYAHEGGRLAFAPEVKGVLCAPYVERKLNAVAVAEYVRFQQLLGVKTFHEGIEQFPYASVGVFDLKNGDWKLRRYWDWDAIPDRNHVSFEEGSREAGRLLREAIGAMTREEDGLGAGVFLSGGLDSRLILGLIPTRSKPVITATYGAAGCRDVYYAEQIARRAGSEHRWFDLADGQWVLDHAALHLKLTEGFHSWVNMHSITMLPTLRGIMDYNLTGWAGEVPLGFPAISQFYAAIDPLDVRQKIFNDLTQTHSWPGLNEAEAMMMFSPEFSEKTKGVAFESFLETFRDYERFIPNNRVDYFYLINHCGRLTGNMHKMTRSHVEVRFPYWDYEFVDFVFSLNPMFRLGKPRAKLYLEVLTREAGHLATIPYDKDEYLPTSDSRLRSAHAFTVRVRRRLKLFPDRPTLYADYEMYLRRELRSWAEGILFDKRTIQRGIFNEEFVRSLMNRHLSGREEWTIGKISHLITFEMMMRQYFD
ncbi:MAG: hypothetical protein J0L63_17075 [Anaerolineae bacterium]|nr:hypothetical protein [Anaerolineae bacterium]